MTLPFLREFFLTLARQGPLPAAVERLHPGPAPVALSGLTPSAQILAAAQLQRLARRPVVLIVPDNATAEAWRDTLTTFVDLTASPSSGPASNREENERPLILPSFEVDPYEGLSPHQEILEQRALALWRAAEGWPFLIVPAVAAITRLGPPDRHRRAALRLRRGDFLDLEGCAEHLATVGYQRQDPVEMPGQFSIRGGLLDVFSPESPRPVRIELFGDEIESLREFDPATQRSIPNEVVETWLLPLTSVPLFPELREKLGEAPAPGWEFRVPALEAFDHAILDYGAPPLVVLSEPEAITAELERWWRRLRQRAPQATSALAVAPESVYFTPEQWDERLRQHVRVELRELAIQAVDLGEDVPAINDFIPFPSRPAPRYYGAIARMMEEVRAQLAAGQRLVFLGANPGEVERLGDLFTEYSVPFQFGARPARSGTDYLAEKAFFSPAAAAVIVAQGALLRGFTLSGQQLTIFGSNDLFQEDALGALGSLAPPARRGAASSFLSDFRDLSPGDYVVHVEHGIGRFLGLTSFETATGQSGEFMLLEYADAAKLYVPLTRMDLVQKYRSASRSEATDSAPVLDRMGGTQWAARKTRVKKAMQDMADELLKLYAARQAVRIAACSPDGNLQREFEDAFPYTETDDQQKAITDVRQDLERPRPMDRLVVGDVGYGKTEVAMRAAFKVVSDGRQVAVLAPTTVLAFQHEQTFRQRFRAFPISIGLLSRFRTKAQQKETIEQLATGKLDIVIGTHRLLSKDVKFQNLGLLVVDEEQRFGVRHKERMKQLKREVHVLAMSATPIPRTLNMSLAGLRDMSVIETPPRDRLAIQTVVAAWSEPLLAAAMRQELERGGQVYFVHNRVDSIWEIAALLQKLAPEARIAVGHGQMAEDELEKVMLQFVRHEADILLSTTIIENGLDIPLANTIIINRADRLGLSELYQLRGRVGRSNRRAYAYLLIPAEAELAPLARKRLAAMREFSDLGAGFKIAALDLELRGAGNMLGGEQSGNLDAVGFDLYVQMLEQTVRELKGETDADSIARDIDLQLHLGLDIRIPAEYVPDENQRLRMYKRLAEAETDAARQDVARELEDRYGPLPAPGRNLLAYAALKPTCRALGLRALERRNDRLWLRFNPRSSVDPARLAAFVERTPGVQFSPDGTLKLPFTVNGAAAILAETDRLLTALGASIAAPR